MKRKLASFWDGPALSPIEQISILSFLATGHELIIYSTGPLEGLPPGVELRDASEILSTSRIIKHRKTGSVALYSDLFRYALLKKTDFIWVDLDIIALRPLPDDLDYIFGYEEDGEVNGAILRLPAGSAALKQLCRFNMDTHGYPPHLAGFRRIRYIVRSFGLGLPISDWPWGSIGPRGLTHYLKQTGEISHALPIKAFYPIKYQETARFTQPRDLTFASFAAETYAVHLWGKALRQHIQKNCAGVIPAESFLDHAISRYSAMTGFAVARSMARQ